MIDESISKLYLTFKTMQRLQITSLDIHVYAPQYSAVS